MQFSGPFPRGAILAIAACLTASSGSVAQFAAYPPSLSGTPVPEPANYLEFVQDRAAAVTLGKALFWDIAVGSDGQTSCATCHGKAGVDPRRTNTIHPGPNGTFDLGVGPGGTKSPHIFPTVHFSDPRSRFSAKLRDVDDIVGSQGVLRRAFLAPGGVDSEELCDDLPDPVFHVDKSNARQVTARNPPTVINSVFNVRNFWDGRANTWFNGVNGLGPLDPNARVWRQVNGAAALEQVSVTLPRSSLASQAVGPALSGVEMSCSGRSFVDLASRLIDRRALASQRVSSTDAVLGSLAAPDGIGLDATYRELITQAFWPRWCSTAPTPDGIPQVEANFPLLFGLAIQAYESTLVSDRTRYDQWYEAGGPAGNPAASSILTPDERRGLDIFVNDGTIVGVPVGNCAACHFSQTFSSATWTALLPPAPGADALDAVELMASAAVAQAGGATFTDYPLPDAPGAIPLDFVLDGALVELFHILPPPDPGEVPGPDDSPVQASVVLPDISNLGCPEDVVRSHARAIHGVEALFSVVVRRRELPGGGCGTSVLVRVQGFLDGAYEIRFNGVARALTTVAASGAYDLGFYNIGVRPTTEDLGQGALQAGGVPLSYARRRQQGLPVPEAPTALHLIDPAIHVQADGVFKTPILRNVELTGPYFHNGGQRTLRQVVEFYNRGGDFHEANLTDLSPEMFALQLTEADIDALVAFLKTLTDERVRDERAPFDHPELPLPNGEAIPPVGAEGRAANCLPPVRSFEETLGDPQTPGDCDGDGFVDSCVILDLPELDVNRDGVLDTCQCLGDVDRSGTVDGGDLTAVLASWGASGAPLIADLNADGIVAGDDLVIVLSAWGACTTH